MLIIDCIFEYMKFPVLLFLMWGIFLIYIGKPIMLMANHSLVVIILLYAISESVNMHNSGLVYSQHSATICHVYMGRSRSKVS